MKKIIFLPILIIVIAIFSILIVSINNGVNLSKLNSMNHDINVLEDSIALYYLNNGNIPIKDKINFEHSINPNDNNSWIKYTDSDIIVTAQPQTNNIVNQYEISFNFSKIYSKYWQIKLSDVKQNFYFRCN